MAFTVEDGTGVAGANSYATVAEANAYFGLRSNPKWDAITDDAAKQRLLILATDFVEEQYASDWIGARDTTLQGLSWPRFEYAGIPENLKRAVFELAVLASSGDLYALPATSLPQSTAIAEETKTLGPITKTVRYAAVSGSAQAAQKLRIAKGRVDALLAPLLANADWRFETVRA